ncbi:MAG: SusC/RagA family protein, partial [Paludibacter sp.]|nr:SusC/RagA family protein [Paludibacter sp.]
NSNVGDRRFMYLAQYAYDKNYGYYLGKTNQKTTGVRVVNDAVDLIWESSQKQDFGIDFKLFNDDLSVIIDLFKEHRTDILLKRDMSIPNFLGYMSDPYGNVGVVDNQGIDASVEYDKKIGKDWIISVRGNITYNKDQWINSDQPAQLYSWMNKRGSNVNGLFGLVANGLYSQDEIDQINAWEALPEVDKEQIARPFPAQFGALQAGDIKYVDLNNDGKIDAYDEKWIGQGDVPKMIYGFGFNVQYKNVAFGMLLQGTSGAERMLSGSSIQPFKGDGGGGNLFSNIYDRWTTDNPRQDVFYPRLAYGSDKADNMNNFKPSTWWIKDVDFLRLKTMQISYNLPSKWAGSVGLQNISVYCMGTNLLTLSSFKLWDPELNTGQGTSYPNIASMSIGLNIGF